MYYHWAMQCYSQMGLLFVKCEIYQKGRRGAGSPLPLKIMPALILYRFGLIYYYLVIIKQTPQILNMIQCRLTLFHVFIEHILLTRYKIREFTNENMQK